MVDKIEVGQRWYTDRGVTIVVRKDEGFWEGDNGWRFHEDHIRHGCILLAPAPKPGQMWRKTGGGTVEIDRWDVESLGVDTGNAFTSFAGSPAAVARWLLCNGYENVEKKAIVTPVEIRDGMTVRSDSSNGTLRKEVDGFRVRWIFAHGERDSGLWSADGVRRMVESGKWAILSTPSQSPSADASRLAKPNVAPLKALADLVAKICETPTREQSRRYVDMAVAQLRGEPFAKAIQTVLVALSDEVVLSARDISAAIDACRAWEKRRGEVAPGRRTLTDSQREHCYLAAGEHCRSWWWPTAIAHVYERARAAC